MRCKHNFKLLGTWEGNLKDKVPDKWLFYCTKCLDIKSKEKTSLNFDKGN